jgi:hypothetical protein
VLEDLMLAELALAGPVGPAMLHDFITNSTPLAIVPHGAAKPLAGMVRASPEFKKAHDKVKDSIRAVVRAGALAGSIDYRELAEPKKKVPPPSLGFGGFQRLHVLIGSFQGVDIFLNDFTADPVKGIYTAKLTYMFFDHFGVDDGDVVFDGHGHGSPGQVAFWVLQHDRHPGHVPYVVQVIFDEDIIDDSF